MSTKKTTQIVNEPVELGNLLANTIGAVVDAQEELDAYTERRRQAYESAPEGSAVLPPLWYVFNNVCVEMELTASVGEVEVEAEPRPHLMCRTLNPSSVSLYGHQASAGLRIRMDLAPEGYLPIKETSAHERPDSSGDGE